MVIRGYFICKRISSSPMMVLVIFCVSTLWWWICRCLFSILLSPRDESKDRSFLGLVNMNWSVCHFLVWNPKQIIKKAFLSVLSIDNWLYYIVLLVRLWTSAKCQYLNVELGMYHICVVNILVKISNPISKTYKLFIFSNITINWPYYLNYRKDTTEIIITLSFTLRNYPPHWCTSSVTQSLRVLHVASCSFSRSVLEFLEHLITRRSSRL